MTPNPTKGASYLRRLDDARCEGNWQAVPELVRKVRKHAPERLAITAETECAIHKAATLAPNPPTLDSTIPDRDVAPHLPKLSAAIEAELNSFEDRFQAQVVAAWLHFVLGEQGHCLARLPQSLDRACPNLDPADKNSEWANVCALKAAYLKASCLVRAGRVGDALVVYEAALPSLAGIWAGHNARAELRYWAELFLSDYCLLCGDAFYDGTKSLADLNSLAAFRSWARYWQTVAAGVNPRGQGLKSSRVVWHQYYLALSRTLEQDLPFPTGHMAKIPPSDPSARSQLRAELKSVEALFESLLLNESKFPRADEQAGEFESFVKLVVRNWSILCGRGWKEVDLGQGGRAALSKGVLDILYRAATKTYHSTAILRFLFLVHLSVAEFELAFKTFDAWLDIVKNAKTRVDKTGRHEPALDDDGTVLETISQCITALCGFAERHAGERARELGAELEDWLARLPQLRSNSDPAAAAEMDGNMSLIHPKIAPGTMALSWQAIGLSQAHWASMTYEAASRTEMQTKAIRCLRKSLSPDYGRPKDARTLYALGLLLAERREIPTAIELVKSALVSTWPTGDDDDGGGGDDDILLGPYWRERSLVPLWHLLALLLSARQEYVLASRACEGALEQFRDPAVLFGSADLMFKSEHLNEAAGKSGAMIRGLVDDMDDSEREVMLEVKMTQLALVELLEGPDVAVNASFELLALYSRLFARQSRPPPGTSAKTGPPPKSAVGTLRSIRGSIFGASRREKARDKKRAPRHEEDEEDEDRDDERQGRTPRRSVNTLRSHSPSATRRPHTMQTAAIITPTIQITHEAGLRGSLERSRRTASVGRRRSESTKRNSLRKRDRETAGSRKRAVSSGGMPRRPTVVDGESFFTPGPEDAQSENFPFPAAPRRSASRRSSFSKASKGLMLIESFMTNKSTDTGDDVFTGTAPGATPAEAYTALAATPQLPPVMLPSDLEHKHRTSILVKVWLIVAGFYRRAEMLDEGRAAVAEAQMLVQALEGDGARRIIKKSREWGVGKSVEELWGDVWSEFGYLSLSADEPYAARDEFESSLIHWPDHPCAIVGLSNILLDMYTEALLPRPAIPALTGPTSPTATATELLFALQPPLRRASAADASAPIPTTPLGLGLDSSSPMNVVRPYAESPRKSFAGVSGAFSLAGVPVPAAGKIISNGGGPGSFLIPALSATSTGISVATANAAAVAQSPATVHAPSRHASNLTNPTSVRTMSSDEHQSQSPEDMSVLSAAYKATTLPLVDRLAARDRAYGLLFGVTRLGTAWNLPEAWFTLARAYEESGRGDRAKEVLWWCVELEEGRAVRDWRDVGRGGYVL